MTPQEQCSGDHRHSGKDPDERALSRHRREVDGQYQRTDHQRGEDPAEVVDPPCGFVHVSRKELRRQHEGGDRQRQRDQEHRAPPETAEECSRCERPQCRHPSADGRPECNRAGARGTCCPECGDERQGGRKGHARGESTEDAGSHQHLGRRSPGGQQARRDRQPHAEKDHHLAAVPIPERAEPEHRGGQTEGEPHRHQVQGGLGRVEGLADVGECDVGHRQVQVGHTRHEDQGAQHQGGVGGGSAVGRGCGVGHTKPYPDTGRLLPDRPARR